MSWIPFLDQLLPLHEIPEKNRQHVMDTGRGGMLEDYERAREWLLVLDKEPEEELSPSLVQNAGMHVREMTTALQVISTYDPGRNQPRDLDTPSSRITTTLVWWKEAARPHIKGGDIAWASRLTQLDTETERIAHLRAETEEAAAEAAKLLESVRKLTEEAGTGELAHYYSTQADSHAVASRWALGAVVGLSVTLALVGWFTLSHIPPTDDWSVFARQIAARVFALGAISYAITFVARIYRSNAHLRAVYQQRAHALDTFSLFARTNPEEEVRNLVLAEVVRSVFSAADSGVFEKGGTTEHTIIESAVPLATALSKQRTSG